MCQTTSQSWSAQALNSLELLSMSVTSLLNLLNSSCGWISEGSHKRHDHSISSLISLTPCCVRENQHSAIHTVCILEGNCPCVSSLSVLSVFLLFQYNALLFHMLAHTFPLHSLLFTPLFFLPSSFWIIWHSTITSWISHLKTSRGKYILNYFTRNEHNDHITVVDSS